MTAGQPDRAVSSIAAVMIGRPADPRVEPEHGHAARADPGLDDRVPVQPQRVHEHVLCEQIAEGDRRGVLA